MHSIPISSVSSLASTKSAIRESSSKLGLMQVLSSLVGVLMIAGLRLPHLLGLPHEAASRALNAADAIAVFAVITPTAAALANLLLPKLLGKHDLAFPGLNAVSFAMQLFGMVLVVTAYAVDTSTAGHSRWLLLTAYSGFEGGAWVSCILAAVIAVGTSHALSAVNVLASVGATTTARRGWSRLPVLAWALYARALMHIVAAPAVVTFAVVALAERNLSLALFDASTGGDPLLALHLFWFGFHPLLISGLVVALAAALETIQAATGADETTTPSQRLAILTFAGTSLLAWGQHLVATSMATVAALAFCAMAMLSLLPILRLVVDAVRALGAGCTRIDGALVFALGTVLLIAGQALLGVASTTLSVSNGFDAVMFGRLGLDLLVSINVFGLTTALLRWWPALTGQRFSESRSLAAAGLVAVGVLLHFLPHAMHGDPSASAAARVVMKAVQLPSAALVVAGAVTLGGTLLSSLRREVVSR